METTPVFIVAIIFIVFYLIIELFVRRKERLMIVEKLAENQSLDIVTMLKQSTASFSALKIGCLLTGLGLGFFVGFLFQHYVGLSQWREISSLYAGSTLTFGGLGLIVAHLCEKSSKK